MEIEAFFAGHVLSWQLSEWVRQVVSGLSAVEQRVVKSQISFRRRTALTWVWRPGWRQAEVENIRYNEL